MACPKFIALFYVAEKKQKNSFFLAAANLYGHCGVKQNLFVIRFNNEQNQTLADQ